MSREKGECDGNREWFFLATWNGLGIVISALKHAWGVEICRAKGANWCRFAQNEPWKNKNCSKHFFDLIFGIYAKKWF